MARDGVTEPLVMLSAREVSVVYANGVTALDRVTIEVHRGDVVGLLGPNGAGKSTLLRVLATLQRPDSGRVSIGDVDALGHPDRARQSLGFLPQEFGFPPALTPLELLDHFGILKGLVHPGDRRAAVHDLLHRVNLWREQHQSVRTLSGGMKQRLGIAVALVGSPEVLIVDEPTVALDPSERHRILDLLVELADDAAVLLSTHLVSDVDALCRRVVILDRGRVVRAGTPPALVRALQGRVFRARVARRDTAALRALHDVVREHLVHGASEVTVIAASAPDHRFTAVEPTLDDVFADATRPLAAV